MAGKTMSDASSSNFGGAERGESVVYDCRRRKSSCGYCKSGSHGSITHGSIDFNDFHSIASCFNYLLGYSLVQIANCFLFSSGYDLRFDVFLLLFFCTVGCDRITSSELN